MRIVVIGSAGQLGSAIVRECASAHDVVALTRAELDIGSPRGIAERLEELAPDAVVNCAAYNDVDGAEREPLKALAVNGFAVGHLARATSYLNAVFVHYGSDFVFDGTATRPYSEADIPNPLSVYGASKLFGELLSSLASSWYVLRLESLFGGVDPGKGKGTVAGMRAKLVAGIPVRVFEDRIVSPSYVPDVARATRDLLERGPTSGLYHCVNSGFCTWRELVGELAAALGVHPRIELVKTSEVILPAARPRYCALSNARLAATGIKMPTWEAAIRHYTGVLPAS